MSAVPASDPVSARASVNTAAIETVIVHEKAVFSHDDACRLARLILEGHGAGRIVLDLGRADEATTSAFARLVLLQRLLRRLGRDLRLTNLRDQAAGLYEVHRLQGVLPRL
jgi:ABC-type transporter Mla MlaB component